MTDGPPWDAVERREVVVVGAGFGGIAATVRLRDQGHDVLVLEEAGTLGGTWRDNAYPGAACDVPSALYSFSFAPNPHWTRTYAPQPEILAYLRRTAAELAVVEHIRFGTALRRADWDERTCRWRLETSSGYLTARWVVAASGPLHRPALPALPGIERFAGEVFHSARWRPEHDLRGRRVAVLGTGASAVQFVPEIAPVVARLVLLQRTAQWVLPKLDRTITGVEHRAFARFPVLQRAVRLVVYAGAEAFTLGMRHPWLLRPLQRAARRNLERHVADPQLRARLRPVDRLGCKRILISNDWYPALTRPHVTVADGHVREVRARSIVDGDGHEHAVDTLILATGYQAAEPAVARWFHDGDGVAMAERFAASGARAHLGTTVTGYPNLFLLAGPNSFVYSSLVSVLEAQVAHVAAALAFGRDHGLDRIEVDPAVERAFDDELRSRLTDTVWTTGCRSWFLDRHGRNTTMWPGTTGELRRRLRRFAPERHRLGRSSAA